MSGLREEILDVFGAINHVTPATVDQGKPRLRPMTVVRWGGESYFATETCSDKVSQMTSNQLVEFILPLREDEGKGYVRVECVAELVEDEKMRSALLDGLGFVKKLWTGSGDPSLTVVRLVPRVYGYMKPGELGSIRVSGR